MGARPCPSGRVAPHSPVGRAWTGLDGGLAEDLAGMAAPGRLRSLRWPRAPRPTLRLVGRLAVGSGRVSEEITVAGDAACAASVSPTSMPQPCRRVPGFT